MERQGEFYHKCHRCEFCGKAADFTLPATNGVARPALREQQEERTVVRPDVAAEAPAAAARLSRRGDFPAPREAAADAG